MTEQIIIKGYWWLPSKPNNAVAGTLTYSPHEFLILELIGQLKPEISATEEFLKRQKENVIFGFSSDAKEISLMDCYPSRSSLNFNCPFPILRYDCQHLIIGTHIMSLDTSCFFKAQVKIPFLSLWVAPSSIETTFFKEKKYCISFKARMNHIDAVDIGDYKLSIDGCVSYQGVYLEPKIKQETVVSISSVSDFSLKSALQQIFLFEQFLSFATLRPLECTQIILYQKTECQQPNIIEYIPAYKKSNEAEHEQDISEKSKFLFTYESIKGEFQLILRKWFLEQTDIAPIRNHLIECVRQKKSFSSGDFIVIIQAIEGFWWRFRDEDYKSKNHITSKKQTSLNTILESLINEFSAISALKLNEINIKEVVDSRHYFSHFVPKNKKPHAKDGLELYLLTKQIRKLLICCLLNFVGFDNRRIINITKDCNNSLLS